MNLKPPCKIIKCIAYPACRTKKTIDCPKLLQHYHDALEEYRQLANQTSKAWGGINMVLPNARNIVSQKPREPDTPRLIEVTYTKPLKRKVEDGKVIIYAD